MIKLDHLTIAVRDYRVSRDWYVENLALHLEFEVPDRTAALQDDAGFTLFLEQEPDLAANSPCVIYFQVDDVDSLLLKLSAANATLIHPPEMKYWGYGIEVADPDGYRLRLWDEKSMRDKGRD